MKEKNTEIAARIAAIISREKITTNAFAMQLGYSRAQTIYDILNGKSAPSCDFFSKFINSEYSARYRLEWIIEGKEPMRPTSAANTIETRSNREFCNGQIEQLEKENERLRVRNEELISEVAVLKHEALQLRAQIKGLADSASSHTA